MPELVLTRVEWSEQVAAILHAAGGPHHVKAYRDRCMHGTGQAWGVWQGSSLVGALVLDIDGDEGVIVAAAGKCDGVNMVDAVLPQVERLFMGVRAVRWHTHRPGLVRKASAMGWAVSEAVARKGRGDGRRQ